MGWHLQQIELKNFKFFNDTFIFPIEKKHILLYGENGSGKSSIVWGLYTLMESRLKSLADVQKYFDLADDQHLRNRYCTAADDSCVKTLFVSDSAGTAPKSYEISSNRITTQAAGDDFMTYTAASFDMFNYRMLSDLIYQKNSREIDLFSGFEKSIFKYLYLSQPYTDINGARPATGGRTAEEWWNYIKSVRLPQTRRSQVNKGSPEYSRFKSLLQAFHNELEAVLMQVERSANQMLRDDLELPNVTIEINVSDIPFNLLKPNRTKSRDGKVHNPKITLKAHVTDANIPAWSTDVQHLATFFNEAKLTCIGIAIRLAISDFKLITTGDVSPVLCIDDLLLSLDMSARIPIIKLLLKKANDRQLLVFTHDRAFCETMKMLIQESRKQSEWKFYEMYERKSRQAGMAPKPIFYPSKSYREKAEEHFEKCDYAASANYLRKYCEEQLKRLLPLNLQLKRKTTGETVLDDLNGMVGTLCGQFRTLYDISLAALPSLQVYRSRLMNPMSHDDAHTPVFKAEIDGAFSEIDKLKAIADTLETICTGEGHHQDEFEMTVMNGANQETLEFSVLEKWTRIDVGGTRYFKDVKIRVTSSTCAAVLLQEYDSLRTVFNTICTSLGLNIAPAVPPAMESTIRSRHTGVALTAI